MTDFQDTVSQPAWRLAGYRYHRYSVFLKERFAKPMRRVTLDAGLGCPNRDGSVGGSGCVFCDNESFSPAARRRRLPLAQQLEAGVAEVRRGRGAAGGGLLAYFQAGTNTYGSVEVLRGLYEAALAHPGVEGLIVGTRPDCVADEVLCLLEELARRAYVAVEYGLQSMRSESLGWMRRGHAPEAFFDAVRRTRGRGIEIGAHVILGLPGEGVPEAVELARALNEAGIDAVKVHNLHAVCGTPLAKMVEAGEVPLLDAEPYADLLIAFLENISPKTVIQRIMGDVPEKFLVAPRWVLQKSKFLQHVENEMARRGTWQGKALL